MNSLPNISQLDEYLYFYIVGRNARRADLNAAHHTMSLRTCNSLDRLSKTWDDPDRKRAILCAFEWLTGCESYEAVFTDESETRVLTEEGIRAGDGSFNAASTFTSNASNQ